MFYFLSICYLFGNVSYCIERYDFVLVGPYQDIVASLGSDLAQEMLLFRRSWIVVDYYSSFAVDDGHNDEASYFHWDHIHCEEGMDDLHCGLKRKYSTHEKPHNVVEAVHT